MPVIEITNLCIMISFLLDIFLLFEGFHILFSIYMAIGFSGSGSGGFINMIAAFGNSSVVTGVFCSINAGVWSALAVVGTWLWTAVHTHTKHGGHSMDKAKLQVATMGLMSSA
jgi:hypothetical protein